MNIESNVQSDVVFHRIVVPHDLTTRSDKAVDLAGTMAHPLRSEVVLINVIDPTSPHENERIHFTSRVGEIARDRWRFLRVAAARLLPADVRFNVCILSGDPQSVILSQAQKLGADLLIITTHPLTGTGYPFSGGKTEHILHKASCPVLTVQVPDEDPDSLAKQKNKNLETHSLKQYCEVSRQLAGKAPRRPVYIGYSSLPANPSGVCD